MYEIQSEQGLSVKVSAIGATVCSIQLNGQELTLGYEQEDCYLHDPYYLGSTVGPFANRIRQAQFQLGGRHFRLTSNDGEHCLHGGSGGLNHLAWQVDSHQSERLVLSCQVADGQGGFPGNRIFVCEYIAQGTELKIKYSATSDALTVVNLTNHCYFNLDCSTADISQHSLQTDLTHFLRKDLDGLPTGELSAVEHELPHLATGQCLAHIFQEFGPLDHCFIVKDYTKQLRKMAVLSSADHSLYLTVLTDLPGLQIYTGDGLGQPFSKRQGICLEAQYWPDSPNHAEFPSTQLAAGQSYQHQIIYRFSHSAAELLHD